MNGSFGRHVRQLPVLCVLFAVVLGFYATVALAAKDGLGLGGRPNPIVLICATVVLAAILPQLRKWVDAVVNRLVFGEHSDAYEVAATFATRLAGTLAVDEVLPRLAETTARSMHSRRASVRLWLSDGQEWRQTWPPAPGAVSDPAIYDPATHINDPDIHDPVIHMHDPAVRGLGMRDLAVQVRHGGAAIGELSVDSASRGPGIADRRLLDELAGPAGLALSTVRLTFELRHRLGELTGINAELQDSQTRLIDARRTERDRLLDDLDRLVQPHIDAVIDGLDESIQQVRSGTREISPQVAVVQSHGSAALDALRALARGIFPPLLANAGVLSALGAWAEQAIPPVRINISGNFAPLRTLPSIETTLYFVCVTAITGQQHEQLAITGEIAGEMTSPALEIWCDDSAVHFSIPWILRQDDQRSRSLVQTLRDRVHAVEGRLEVCPQDPSSHDGLSLTPGVLSGRLPITSGKTATAGMS